MKKEFSIRNSQFAKRFAVPLLIVACVLNFSSFLFLAPQKTEASATSVTFTSTGSTSWTVPAGVNSVQVLVVAGGGGGGSNGGGGGGGGGVRCESVSVTPGASVTVTVGAGGGGSVNGGNSVFGTVTATGGGAGGSRDADQAGHSGGSGGGGTRGSGGGAGTAGQGNNGGVGTADLGAASAGGGGGGAGAVGGNGSWPGPDGSSGVGGAGGAGTTCSITGSTVYGGGGGGACPAGFGCYAGSGGSGGGGAGGSPAANGTANTGGGGGAGGSSPGSGGSGIVVVSYSRPAISKPPNNLGLMGYWSFDEATSTKATDFSGNGNTGTLTNIANPPTSSSGWGDGKRGKAINVDGVDDYVNVDGGGGLNNLQTGSIAMWVRWSGTQDAAVVGFGCVSGRQSNTIFSNDVICLSTSNPSTAKVTWAAYTGDPNITGATSVGSGVWRHVVVTFSSGSHVLYVDGVQDGTSAQTGTISNNSAVPLSIGAWIGDGGGFAGAKIDDVRIYNRVLGATEVAALARSGTVKFTSNSKTLTQGSSLENGLVGLWTFDGADVNWTSASAGVAYDRSGNNNTGTLTNMSRSGSVDAGKLGQALNFNGSSQKVSISHSSSLDLASTLTISAWVYPTSFGFLDGIVSKYQSGGGNEYFLRLNSIAPYTKLNCGGGTDVTSVGTLTANTWHHVSCVISGGTASIYINGVLDNSGSASVSSGSDSVVIGEDFAPDGTRLWNGKIDDVRIYNRALTAAEVLQLYRLGGAKVR